MNKTIKIGYLFPYSSIHPDMSQDIMDGFFSAIPDQYRSYFRFYPEFVSVGGLEHTRTAVNKLTMFDNVDVLSGFLSYSLLPQLTQLIGTKQQLCFFFDMGEYLPPLTTLPKTFFYNSFQFWQQQYALGFWAQNQFKGKGAILMSLYDAGYHIHSTFWQGAQSAGAVEIDMHTITYGPDSNDIKTMLPEFFKRIEDSNVDYLHALFCGNEALDFFRMYKESGLDKKIPLVVSPHMASDAITSKLGGLNIDFYSASGWSYDMQSDVNTRFKQQFAGYCGRKASVFAVMGYEMGLAFYEIFPLLQRGDIDGAITMLQQLHICGPRGRRNFWIDNKDQKTDVDIEKVCINPFSNTKMVVDKGVGMEYNHAVFEDIHTQCKSGWKNPYLCI